MKILVVDDQADAVGALAQGLREATGHEVVEAVGGQQALEFPAGRPARRAHHRGGARRRGRFRLNESLRAVRPELRTIYVTGYDLTQYAEYINGTPVFYKPADPREVAAALETTPETHAATPVVAVPATGADPGTEDARTVRTRSASLTDELPIDQRSQSSKLRHLVGKQGFTGKLDQFDLVDIIQMCCVSKRTGRLQIARRKERGVLYLRGGQIIQAVSGGLEGEEAAYEIIGWSTGSFPSRTACSPTRRRSRAAGSTSSWKACAAATNASTPRVALPRPSGRSGARGQDHRALPVAPQNRPGRAQPGLRGGANLHGPRRRAEDAAARVPGGRGAVQTFLAQASAKANVQHPSILAVYGAGRARAFIITRASTWTARTSPICTRRAGRWTMRPRCSASGWRPRR